MSQLRIEIREYPLEERISIEELTSEGAISLIKTAKGFYQNWKI